MNLTFSVFEIKHKLAKGKRNHFVLLGINWFDFHLSSFSGVVFTLPVIPIHTVSIRGVLTVMIETVQVGGVTASVPPGSLECLGAVTTIYVIISIFSGKRHATMVRK